MTKNEELSLSIENGIYNGLNRFVWDFTKGLLWAIAIVFVLGVFWYSMHWFRYTPSDSQSAAPFNHDGWGNDYSCFYDNEITQCGKTHFCASHVTQDKCYGLNGTWELETEERFWSQWFYFEQYGK